MKISYCFFCFAGSVCCRKGKLFFLRESQAIIDLKYLKLELLEGFPLLDYKSYIMNYYDSIFKNYYAWKIVFEEGGQVFDSINRISWYFETHFVEIRKIILIGFSAGDAFSFFSTNLIKNLKYFGDVWSCLPPFFRRFFPSSIFTILNPNDLGLSL